MLDRLWYGVRQGTRGLLRDLSFTVVAVVSIGLGVGANSAIFSLIDQAFLRPLPAAQPDRLVLLTWRGSFVGSGWGSGDLLPHPFFRDLAAQTDVFAGLCARFPTNVNLGFENDTPEPVNGEIVSGSYFRVLGVGAALGRVLDDSDDRQPSAHPVVVVSYDFWRNRLGGRPDVVGRKVSVNSHPMTVVGVAAAGFRGVDWGEVSSFWVPTMMKKEASEFDWLDDRRGRWLHVFGRLKPGMTVAQAEAALQPWFKRTLEADTRHESWPVVTAEQRRGFLASTLAVLPAAGGRSDLRERMASPLAVLLAATGLVLLLACLNVANLLVARAFARRSETALRLALGASPGRIVTESLMQSALLALVGGTLGILLAPAVIGALISFFPSGIDLVPAVNPRVLWLSLAIAVGTGLLFGLLPALHASREEAAFTLKEGSARVAGGLGLRRLLVVGQVALAVVLLIGAGLFVRTLRNLRAQGPGFQTTNLLSFRLNPQRSGYPRAEARALMRTVLDALRSRPEVQGAGISTAGLLEGGSWNAPLTIESEGRVVTNGAVHLSMISPGFFDTLGAGLLAGRDFDARDERDERDRKAAGVSTNERDMGFGSVIVNESFARRYFGDRSPLGARIGLGNRPDTVADKTIVGVVHTFSYRGLRQVDDQAFFPYFAGPVGGGGFYLRTRTGSGSAFAAVRAAVRQVDPGLTVGELRTLDDQLDRSLANERLLATLATTFAGLAVLLAVVGLYGVTSFVVARRTREIGIRLALGSSRGGALWLVLRDTAMMVGAGLALALPAVWALGRLVQSQLFGLTALDGTTIAAAALLIALVALGASALPAHRAASVSPTEALRYE
jgi:putative ABC transport system permease protein